MSERLGGRVGTRRSLVVASEIGLLAVTLAAVLAMGRLFDGGGWLGPMAASAVAAHAVAALLRRRGASLLTSAAVMAVAAAVVTTWVNYWSTTRFGIPTSDTWSAMQADLDEAWSLYQDVVAPTPAVPGFVAASCLALWVVAYIGDWAAFRLWVPFEATLPAGTLFLFVALLGEPGGRGWSVALYAGSLIGFLLLHRMARQDGSSHWVADRRVAGTRSLLIAGSALGVTAVVAGSVLWPAVPGARSPGVFDPTEIGANDPRRTLSPLADLRSRLVEQSAVEMFRVESPVRSYWRLTALEDFDGRVWESSGSFGEEDGELPETVPVTVDGEEFEQSITITNLSAIWLPSAYEPRAIDIDETEVRYDEDSATLIVNNELTSSDGLSYRVTSKSPRIDEDDLTGTPDEIPNDIRDEYLRLPDGFSDRVRELAEETVGRAATPAAQARALQDYLRDTFEYTLEVQPRRSDDPLEDFLFENRAGFCQQFAGAFAAMARAVGIPARVAVGFTPGQPSPELDDTYIVRGEYAHAWPEVYIAGAGWVPYEPTPNRGIPSAFDYTGVEEQQAEAGNATGFEITPTTAPAETIPTLPGDTTDEPRNPDDELFSGDAPDQGSSSEHTGIDVVRDVVLVVSWVYVGLVLLWVLLLPIALLVRRSRRRRFAASPLDQVQLAWTESAEAAGIVGFQEAPSDTHVERALQLGALVPEAADPALTLAARIEVGIYSPEGADPDDATVAWEAAERIQAGVRAHTSTRDRLNWWLNPGWLYRSWRLERSSRQRRITLTPRGDLEAERELVGSDDRG